MHQDTDAEHSIGARNHECDGGMNGNMTSAISSLLSRYVNVVDEGCVQVRVWGRGGRLTKFSVNGNKGMEGRTEVLTEWGGPKTVKN